MNSFIATCFMAYCCESFYRMWRSFLRLHAITFSAHCMSMFIFSGLKIYMVNSQSVGLHLYLLLDCAGQEKLSWTDDQGWSPLAQHQLGGSLLTSLDNVWKLFKPVPDDLKTLDDTSFTRIVGERLNCKSRIILLINSKVWRHCQGVFSRPTCPPPICPPWK